MADLADFAWGVSPALTLAGSIDVDDVWVHATGSLTCPESTYGYGRVNEAGELLGDPSTPPHTLWGRPAPLFFCRLPNPPYGAQIIYTEDDTAPNAMTELDPSNVGVYKDLDYYQGGKFLASQVRSVSVDPEGNPESPANWPNGVSREYTYESLSGWVLDFSGPSAVWVRGPTYPITLGPRNWDMVILSRGVYTYLGLTAIEGPAPGQVIDFDVRWWNGVGFRCVVPPVIAFGDSLGGVVPIRLGVRGA
jgi:hypothetical protein